MLNSDRSLATLSLSLSLSLSLDQLIDQWIDCYSPTPCTYTRTQKYTCLVYTYANSYIYIHPHTFTYTPHNNALTHTHTHQVGFHVLFPREQTQHQGPESWIWSWKVGPKARPALEADEYHPEAPLPAHGPQGQGTLRIRAQGLQEGDVHGNGSNGQAGGTLRHRTNDPTARNTLQFVLLVPSNQSDEPTATAGFPRWRGGFSPLGRRTGSALWVLPVISIAASSPIVCRFFENLSIIIELILADSSWNKRTHKRFLRETDSVKLLLLHFLILLYQSVNHHLQFFCIIYYFWNEIRLTTPQTVIRCF